MWIRSLELTRLIVNIFFICISFGAGGCIIEKNLVQADPFAQVYSSVEDFETMVDTELENLGDFITLSAYKMPLSVLTRILSDKFSIGIVYAEELGLKEITAEIKSSDLQSVLNVISRQVSVDVIRSGSTYYIGKLRPEDRGILVRKSYGVEPSELNQILTSMVSTQGKCNVTSDGILVVSDHETVLRRCSEMCDYIDASESPTWILQLYFVSLRKDAMVSAGIATKSSGAVSYDIAENKFNLDEAKIEALFTFDTSSQFADVYASPMLLSRDGKQSSWSDGESVPIAKKTVSDYGTVSTTDFQYTDVGFMVNSKIQRTKKGLANLVLSVTMSEIKGFVETAPRTVKTAFNVDLDVQPNKLYLLGDLSIFKDVDSQEKILRFGTTTGRISLQVWGKVYKVRPDIKAKPRMYQKAPVFERWSLDFLK